MLARITRPPRLAARASAAPLARAPGPAVLPTLGAAAAAAMRGASSGAASTPGPTRACPSCGAQIPYPASPCPSCGGLVRVPRGLSMHSLLGVSDPLPLPPPAAAGPPAFDVRGELEKLPALGYELDPRDLRVRMLRRQQKLHPDAHAAGGGDTELAAELSALVNRAYETLASPLRRAEYILSQFGKETEETDAVDDHELLMEILDARETLEEAELSEVEQLREENHAKVVQVVERIDKAFRKHPPDIHHAKRLAVELKYWVGLEEAAKEKLSNGK